MDNKLKLELEITDILINYANDMVKNYNELTTSDYQGIAQAKAQEIINKVKLLSIA